MPFGVSWYCACARVIFSSACDDDTRNDKAAEIPLIAARMAVRRDQLNFLVSMPSSLAFLVDRHGRLD
jgi:hypothetical protein